MGSSCFSGVRLRHYTSIDQKMAVVDNSSLFTAGQKGKKSLCTYIRQAF